MKSALVAVAVALVSLAGPAQAEDACPILEGRYECKSLSFGMMEGAEKFSVDEMPNKLAMKNLRNGSVVIIDTKDEKEFWPHDMVESEGSPIRLRSSCVNNEYQTVNQPIEQPVRLRGADGVVRDHDWSSFLFKTTIRKTEEGFVLTSSAKSNENELKPYYELTCKKIARLPFYGTFTEGLAENPQERPDHRAQQSGK